jgi:hypothetical protein
MKICKICTQSLPLEQFGKAYKSVYRAYCKKCSREISKQNYQENIEVKKQNYQENIEVKKQYYQENKEQHIKRSKEWIKNNHEKAKINWKLYNKNNREKKNKYIQDRFKNDPEFKIICIMRSRILQVLKNKKQNKSIDFLGCSSNEFKLHLEKQFLPEMNWENHGVVWEIDHIKPICTFDLLVKDNIFKAFHYTNTQPLFKTTEIAESFGYKNYTGNKNKKK